MIAHLADGRMPELPLLASPSGGEGGRRQTRLQHRLRAVHLGELDDATPIEAPVFLGTGFGDRFGVPRGISGTVKAMNEQGAKPA